VAIASTLSGCRTSDCACGDLATYYRDIPDAEFADEIQIGAEAGRHDQFIDDNLTSATTVAGPDEEARAVGGQMRDTEFTFHPYLARCDQPREGCTQRAAGGKLVVGAAAKSLGRIIAA